MAVGVTKRGPRCGANRFRIASVGQAIAATLLFGLVGCGDGMTKEERDALELRNKVATAYAQAIDRIAPAHVVLTWPDRYDRLPEQKQLEIDVVHEVLTARALPTTRGRRDDYVEVIEVGRGRRRQEMPAYVVPIPIAEECREQTVLFINFAVDRRLTAAQHPRTADYGLDVLVWDDPVSISTRRYTTY